MKTLAWLALTFFFLLALPACSDPAADLPAEVAPPGKEETTAPPAEVEEADQPEVQSTAAIIQWQVEDYEADHFIQIPLFVLSRESAAIQALNARITAELLPVYQAAKLSKPQRALEMSCTRYQQDGYAQALVRWHLGEEDKEDSIASYVYDIAQDRALSLGDAYLLADTSEDALDILVEELLQADQFLEYTESAAFLITGPASIEFYLYAMIDTEDVGRSRAIYRFYKEGDAWVGVLSY